MKSDFLTTKGSVSVQLADGRTEPFDPGVELAFTDLAPHLQERLEAGDQYAERLFEESDGSRYAGGVVDYPPPSEEEAEAEEAEPEEEAEPDENAASDELETQGGDRQQAEYDPTKTEEYAAKMESETPEEPPPYAPPPPEMHQETGEPVKQISGEDQVPHEEVVAREEAAREEAGEEAEGEEGEEAPPVVPMHEMPPPDVNEETGEPIQTISGEPQAETPHPATPPPSVEERDAGLVVPQSAEEREEAEQVQEKSGEEQLPPDSGVEEVKEEAAAEADAEPEAEAEAATEETPPPKPRRSRKKA